MIPFPSYWVGFAIFIYGFMVWINELKDSMSSLIFAKAIGALVLLAATTLNMALSASAVNSILEVPSSAFRYTITITSILLIPLSASLILFFVTFLLVPIAMLTSIFSVNDISAKKLLSFEMFKSSSKISAVILFGRIFACIVVLSTAISFLQNNGKYTDTVGDFIKWFAYSFEMEQFSYCQLPKNGRIAYLSGNNVIIGEESKSTYTFRVVKCAEKP